MLKRLAVLALTALVTAVVFMPHVRAGDDAEKLLEAREKVRAKYKDDKGGYPFYDLVYWVDAEDLEDSRWSMDTVRDPDHTNGPQLIANWTNEASAAEGMNIRVFVQKLVHEKRNGNTRNVMNVPFDNLGKQVKSSDADGILEGFYEDWKRGAKDVLEDKCEKPQKCRGFKVAENWAAAVGTDPETDQRIRKEWYVWKNGKEMSTYVAFVTYGTALHDKEGLVEKGAEFVKAIREIKDKVKWE